MKLISYKINDVREKLSVLLSKKFLDEGFEYKKTNNWFVKPGNSSESIFYILLHSRSDHYAIEVFLFIKQKQVEKTLKKILGSTTGITMGDTIGVIFNSPDGRQVVNNLMEILLIEDADIVAAAETIEYYYDKIAKPYFDKYNSLDAIDSIFNNAPFEFNPAHIGGTFDDRCMRGLIISKLVNSLNYESLVKIYDDVIKTTMNAKSIEGYRHVKEYLTYNKL